MTRIGVLALQGDFLEHIDILERIGVECLEVRQSGQLAEIDGLIIPGGESTTIGKLAVDFNMLDDLKEFGTKKPICHWFLHLIKRLFMLLAMKRLCYMTVDLVQ